MGDSTERQLLIEWRGPNVWRNATIERIEVDGKTVVATLLLQLPTKSQKPYPLSREMPGNAGIMQYRFEVQLTMAQYQQYQQSIRPSQHQQRWKLPTSKGASEVAWAFAVTNGHNPSKVIGNTRRRKTMITDLEENESVVYWRVVYIRVKGSNRVFAYMVESSFGEIHIDPNNLDLERKRRELPILIATLEEALHISNWSAHRKMMNVL